MKKLFLLGVIVMAMLTVTAAYPAHPVFVNPPDFSDATLDSFQTPEENVQLAQWSRKCHCCWVGRHGKIWCKWVRVHRCWRTGGRCR